MNTVYESHLLHRHQVDCLLRSVLHFLSTLFHCSFLLSHLHPVSFFANLFQLHRIDLRPVTRVIAPVFLKQKGYHDLSNLSHRNHVFCRLSCFWPICFLILISSFHSVTKWSPNTFFTSCSAFSSGRPASSMLPNSKMCSIPRTS